MVLAGGTLSRLALSLSASLCVQRCYCSLLVAQVEVSRSRDRHELQDRGRFCMCTGLPGEGRCRLVIGLQAGTVDFYCWPRCRNKVHAILAT